MIKLVIEPGVTKSWEAFLKENPPFSIALDGYVDDPPGMNEKTTHLNLDHHSGVVSWATRSTSAQVEMWLTMGLFKRFQKNGEPEAIVYVNDSDQDVCLSWWLLNNHDRIVGDFMNNPRIEALLRIADRLDSTSDLYPMDHKSKLRKEVNWIFEPYTLARKGGKIKKMSANEQRNVIEAVCWRITLYVDKKGGELDSDNDYEKLCSGKGWVMIREKGNEGKYQAFVDYGGVVVCLLGSSTAADGVTYYQYTISRANPCIPFPMPKFFRAANLAEGIVDGSSNKWGGNEDRGGSPRATGSKLDPESLAPVMNKVLEAEKV